MEIDKIALGHRIRSIRLEKSMNLKEFGFYIDNTSDSIVSRWEKGKSVPNAKRLKLIANAGGISVDELLYGNRKEIIMNMIDLEIKKQVETFSNSDYELDSRLKNFIENNQTTIKNNALIIAEKVFAHYSLEQLHEAIRQVIETQIFDSPKDESDILFNTKFELRKLKVNVEQAYQNNDPLFIIGNRDFDKTVYDFLVGLLSKTIDEINDFESKYEK
jgi:transcriptional regulator with XRE-family HTH domain